MIALMTRLLNGTVKSPARAGKGFVEPVYQSEKKRS
jgi:hypothetical protein